MILVYILYTIMATREENIEKILEMIPERDRENARADLEASLAIWDRQKELREARLKMINSVENEDERIKLKRIDSFTDIFRSILDIDEEVENQTLVEAFLEDFPDLEDDFVNYVDTGDNTILHKLAETPWTNLPNESLSENIPSDTNISWQPSDQTETNTEWLSQIENEMTNWSQWTPSNDMIDQPIDL